MTKDVLVIDSDFENYKEIQRNLQDGNTEVHYSKTISEGLHKMMTHNYSLIIMDVLLSENGGHDVISVIREKRPMPILVLSEQASTEDKVLALKNGADDFLEKPYDLDECLARAQALMRRYTELNHVTQRGYAFVTYEDVFIDTARRIVYAESRKIELTRKEYDLLIYFMKNRSQVLTYEQIYRAVWHEDYFGENSTIFYHIGQLRKKLNMKAVIESVHGVGYRLKGA